jgi:hypothetical protein
MPEQLTNDSQFRAKLILDANGRLGGIDWSVTVTDGNANFGGYGFQGASLSVSVAGNTVVNEANKSYDFGGSTGSNTIVANAFFPRTGRSFSGSIGLAPGTYNVSGTFTTTGNVGTASISFSVTVPAPPTPSWGTGTTLPTATRGTAYSATVSASPVTSYSAIGSSGQTGGLSASGNVISGTPNTVGTANFTIRADNSGSIADRTFSITINPALPVFSDATVANARVGSSYSDGVAASEVPSNGYSLRNSANTGAGTLPAGLSLNTSTGAITGTPTATGTTQFRIRATNVTGSTDTSILSILVSPPGNRHNGTNMATDLTTAKRFDGSSWVDITTFKRFNGTAWVDIVN